MDEADVEQLRSLAKKFESSGSNLLNIVRTLDRYINSTDTWRGLLPNVSVPTGTNTTGSR
jgi:hypothetical protein